MIHASEIEGQIGYIFNDKTLLKKAFIHSSFVNEIQRSEVEDNERLEFLGDSVLSLIVSDYLFNKYTNVSEGQLSELRSKLVGGRSLHIYMDQLDVSKYLIVGKGDTKRTSLTSHDENLFEAIIGAIYLDGGIYEARKFLFDNFEKSIVNIINTRSLNMKSELQDYVQKNYREKPTYEVVSESGQGHCKLFLVSVNICGREIGRGSGNSKKEAEQNAAKNGIEKIII